MLYSYASLGSWDLGVIRLLGTGLGNLLFPWARCIAASRKHHMVPIAPTWTQIKLGPILRKEPDKRLYWDLFDSSHGYVRGVHKLHVLARTDRIEEAEFLAGTSGATGNRVVVFRGMEGFFSRILGDHVLVRRELIEMTRTKHRQGLAFDFGKSISVHARLGDFKLGNRDTEMAWFVDTVRKVRSQLGEGTRVHVFSDGSEDELRPLLALGNVGRVSFGSSIGDMLGLSSSRVVVASGGSTFGMWASYLGRMPIVWPARGSGQKLYYEQPEAEIVRSRGEDLPATFVQVCRRAIAR